MINKKIIFVTLICLIQSACSQEIDNVETIFDNENNFKLCSFNSLNILNLQSNKANSLGFQYIEDKEQINKYSMLFTLSERSKQVMFHMNNVHTNLFTFLYDQNGKFVKYDYMNKDVTLYNNGSQNTTAKDNVKLLNNNEYSYKENKIIVKYVLEVPFEKDEHISITGKNINLIKNDGNKVTIPYYIKSIKC